MNSGIYTLLFTFLDSTVVTEPWFYHVKDN